jgi:hypothetical protein
VRARKTTTKDNMPNIISLSHKLPDLEKWANAPADKLTFNEFQDNFEVQARALLIPEENWSRLLPLYLQDGALITFKNLVEKNSYLADEYDELMAALTREFQTSSGVMSTVDLYNKKKQPSESVGKYYNFISSTAKRLYPNMPADARDQIILGAFINGLPTSFQRQLLNNQTIKTSEDAFKISQRLERTNDLLQDANAQQVNQLTEVNHNLRMDIENMKRSLKHLEDKERERAQHQDDRSRHTWRQNNLRRPPIGPNKYRYTYQTKGRQFQNTWQPNRNNRTPSWQRQNGQTTSWYRPNNFQSNWRGQNHNQPGSNNYAQNQPYNNHQNFNTTPRPPLPIEHPNSQQFRPNTRPGPMQRAIEYNAHHTGPEFTTDGRPICQNCNQTGHLQYQCSRRREDDSQPMRPVNRPQANTRRVQFSENTGSQNRAQQRGRTPPPVFTLSPTQPNQLTTTNYNTGDNNTARQHVEQFNETNTPNTDLDTEAFINSYTDDLNNIRSFLETQRINTLTPVNPRESVNTTPTVTDQQSSVTTSTVETTTPISSVATINKTTRDSYTQTDNLSPLLEDILPTEAPIITDQAWEELLPSFMQDELDELLSNDFGVVQPEAEIPWELIRALDIPPPPYPSSSQQEEKPQASTTTSQTDSTHKHQKETTTSGTQTTGELPTSPTKAKIFGVVPPRIPNSNEYNIAPLHQRCVKVVNTPFPIRRNTINTLTPVKQQAPDVVRREPLRMTDINLPEQYPARPRSLRRAAARSMNCSWRSIDKSGLQESASIRPDVLLTPSDITNKDQTTKTTRRCYNPKCQDKNEEIQWWKTNTQTHLDYNRVVTWYVKH